jgi:diazepam-binding inhibitor (GABA receptor modulating acyl-CoA-binding protein)
MQYNNIENKYDIEKEFKKYCNLVKLLPKRPTDEDLLLLYGLYKQATLGDNTLKEPSGMFNVKEKRKWKSWYELQGMDKSSAMSNYINKVNELIKLNVQ